MATQTEPVKHETEAPGAVALHDLGWTGYKTLMRLRGERRRPKLVYLDGTVYLMSPSLPHEHLVQRLGDLVKAVAFESAIPYTATGATTLRRRSKEVGVEGDQTFYIANVHRIAGKKELDLRVDPPPDLAIEAVYSHAAATKLEVYRRLRVPEVWVADQSQVTIHILNPKNRYRVSTASLAFPFLKAAEIQSWIVRDQDESDYAWMKSLRAWVNETLKPRAATAGTKPE